MLFNSFAFFVFLPLVFFGYWFVFHRSLRSQNLFLIAASYVFYGWWDWRFLILLFLCSYTDYWLGLYIDRNADPLKRKRALVLSLVFNLGILGFFKYFNFFIDSFTDLLHAFGLQANPWTLRVLLPVGVSFYTFQSLSYTIEAYRRNFKPEREPIAYLAFVSFFPHMVAGPIMRAIDLLPQFTRPRVFDLDKARDGARQVLWGFFKKIVIADQCAPLVNSIFAGDASQTPGITLFFGLVFFGFQIYGDFSGYSDIAIGTARFFGIDLMRNFSYPYFSRGIGEFWRRWHISLSSWFRDFLFLPLGGPRVGRGRLLFNLMVTFTISGLWHGANWTFVTWGALNGAYCVLEAVSGSRARTEQPVLRDLPRILFTFLLVTLTWVFFRSATLGAAVDYLRFLCANLVQEPGALMVWLWRPQAFFIAALIIVEWLRRDVHHPMQGFAAPVAVRWGAYLGLTVLIFLYLDLDAPNEFIYYQF